MKNKTSYLVACILTAISFTGCSFTPYQDNFSCVKGVGEGACDSVSNIYQESIEVSKARQKSLFVDNSTSNSASNAYVYNKDINSLISEIKTKCKKASIKSNCDVEEICVYKTERFTSCFEREASLLIGSSVNRSKEEIEALSELLHYQNLRIERMLQKNVLGENKND